ncbi:MAG TPA: transglutaminase-like domain-containing protein [Streptosporangiaceae bacterium]|nr:transglutaminase-like domain-containing protein [Streptosporangiaceae bacterium]
MSVTPPTLPFYTEPGRMTSAGQYAALLEPLPSDIGGLAEVAHGLVVHEHMAQGYGLTLTDSDRATVHLRHVDQLLGQIIARDGRPLSVAREPAGRVAGNCRHFTVLTVAALRAHGIPARARCGFGGYFGTSMFEDHWVCEYWNADQQRWILADAQIDDVQREWFPIDFDLTDVPRDRFVIAGQAWAQYRAGTVDPDDYGLSIIKESGDWWIAGNLMRDAAALLNIELLPWDCWGIMPTPADHISEADGALFDELATLTREPDESLAELQHLMQDDRLRVPPKVRSAARQRDEAI